MHPAKSIAEWGRWKGSVEALHAEDHEELWLVVRARTAMGVGPLDEQLIRLMVWVGATLHHGPKHSNVRDPLGMLKLREGWCDQQAKLFCFFAYHFFGIEGRTVSLKNRTPPDPNARRAGHTVAEVFYKGDWHLFDVHKDQQTVYRNSNGKILSVAALRQTPALVAEQPHWWRAYGMYGKDGFYSSSVEPVNTALNYDKDCAWPWSSKP